MALHTDTEIYKSTYDLSKLVTQLVANMPRNFKADFGAELAAPVHDPGHAHLRGQHQCGQAAVLQRMRMEIETVNLSLRLAVDLRLISVNQYSRAIAITDSIGKQATGWQKYSERARCRSVKAVRPKRLGIWSSRWATSPPKGATGISADASAVIPRSLPAECSAGRRDQLGTPGPSILRTEHEQQQPEQRVPSSSRPQTPPRHTMDTGYSLEKLVQAYFDCRQHKRTTASALLLSRRWSTTSCNCMKSCRMAATGPVHPSALRSAGHGRAKSGPLVSDRIVHHLLYNQIADRFHRRFIADSCACIPGAALYAAQRLEAKVRSQTQNWSVPGIT
jgi:hypothetical protein